MPKPEERTTQTSALEKIEDAPASVEISKPAVLAAIEAAIHDATHSGLSGRRCLVELRATVDQKFK